MAVIAELKTVMTADNTALLSSIDASSSKIATFASSASSAMLKIVSIVGVVAAVRSVSHAIEETTDKLSELHDSALRLGVTAEALQELNYAGAIAGASADDISNSLKFLAKNVSNAANGATEIQQKFERLGLSAEKLKGMSLDEEFIAVSDALKEIKSPVEQVELAMGLMGRGGSKMLSLVKDDVKGLVKEYKNMGVELSGKQVEAADELGDNLTRLNYLWEGFKNNIYAALNGPLNELTVWATKEIKQMGGMENAAKSFAHGMVTGMESAIETAKSLLNTLTKVELILATNKMALDTQKLKEATTQLQVDKTHLGGSGSEQATKLASDQGVIEYYKQEIAKNTQRLADLQKNLDSGSPLVTSLNKLDTSITTKSSSGSYTINGKNVADMASGTGNIGGRDINQWAAGSFMKDGNPVKDLIPSGGGFIGGQGIGSAAGQTIEIKVSLDQGLLADKIDNSPNLADKIIFTVNKYIAGAAATSKGYN